MKYKLPIGGSRKPILTQKYGETSNNEWYKAHGINNPFHNGCDFVTGTNVQTYGTPLVSPFKGRVVKVTFDSPMSTKGNGVTIESDPIGDVKFQVILWHTGELQCKVGDILNEGQVVCYIGNSGLVNPSPTPDNPYAGSHLHLGCYKYRKGTGNVWSYEYDPNHTVLGECDPLLWFDKDQWYQGPDSGPLHDMEPLKWSWSVRGVTDWFIKLVEAFNFWNK